MKKLSSVRMRKAKRNGWKSIKIDNKISGISWFEIIQWCENNIIGNFKQSFITNTIAFENEKDYLIFVLKWHK